MSEISRRWFREVAPVALVGVLLSLGSASAAAAGERAAGIGSDDQVVLTGRLVVAEGETVGDAVILNGDATVDGTVTGDLVVLNGDAEIAGLVRGGVAVLNGAVVVRSTAEIDGDLSSIEAPQIERGATIRGAVRHISRLDWGRFRFAWRIAWWVGYTGSSLLLGLILLLFAPGLDALILDAVRNRSGAALGFGAAVFFLVPIGAGVLVITVVGIPLSIFVFLALALLYTVGYVLGAHALGRVLVKPPTSRFLAFLAGWAILRVIAIAPFAGGVVWLVAAIFGLGALFAAARRPRVEVTAPPALPAPPAP
jgi:hypothetical protein